MGRLWDVAGSLRTLVESAVATDADGVYVTFAPPEGVGSLGEPKFIAIWPAGSSYDGPLTFGTGAGNMTQEGTWRWDLSIGIGTAGEYARALEMVDAVEVLLDASLIGTEPTGSGPLYVEEHHVPVMATETHVVFRMTVAHYRLDE